MQHKAADQHGWWQLFHTSRLPAYVTCIHPKIFGITLSKGRHKVTQVEVDDSLQHLDDSAFAADWEASTFELKPGTCVLVLPSNADSPSKQLVEQPWIARINTMWFIGDREALQPQVTDDPEVLEWEKRQLQSKRLSTRFFQLEVNYLYRLSDLVSEHIVGSSGVSLQNNETLCQALVTLGIVDSVAAGKKLIKETVGTSKASRLLNRIVVYSTHQGKLGAATESSSDEDDEDEGEEQASATDAPIPMESVMSLFKVMYLGRRHRLPYMHAPAPPLDKAGHHPAGLNAMQPAKRAAFLDELQQEHVELPPGFFCSLIYIKQTGQLFSLEDWASGSAGHRIKGDWVQPSRKQAKELLAGTKTELQALARQLKQQLEQQRDPQFAGPSRGLSGAAAGPAAAAAAGADSAAAQQEAGTHPSAAPPSGPWQQQQQQHPHRRTPRKSQHPRKAEPHTHEGPPRKRLRPAAEAAAGAAAGGYVIVNNSSSDMGDDGGSDGDDAVVLGEDNGVGSDGDQGKGQPRKRARGPSAADSGSSSSSGSEGSQELGSDGEGKQEERHAAQQKPRHAAAGAAAAAGGGAELEEALVVSSSSVDDADNPGAAAAGRGAAAGPRRAGKGRQSSGEHTAECRVQAAAAAAAAGASQQQRRRDSFKSSKGAVLTKCK